MKTKYRYWEPYSREIYPKAMTSGDCSVRAYCKMENMEYGRAYAKLVEKGYGGKGALYAGSRKGRGRYKKIKFWASLGYEFRTFPSSLYNHMECSIDYTPDTCIVNTVAHVAPKVNGVLYDAFDSRYTVWRFRAGDEDAIETFGKLIKIPKDRKKNTRFRTASLPRRILGWYDYVGDKARVRKFDEYFDRDTDWVED